jgi:adenine-specific DNA glycosylase
LDVSGATSPDALANLPHNAEACPTVSAIGDADLRAVIAAWPTLPEHARARVLAIVAENRAD